MAPWQKISDKANDKAPPTETNEKDVVLIERHLGHKTLRDQSLLRETDLGTMK